MYMYIHVYICVCICIHNETWSARVLCDVCRVMSVESFRALTHVHNALTHVHNAYMYTRKCFEMYARILSEA